MLKNIKAPGDDEILMSKKGRQGFFVNQIYKFMNTIWEQKEIHKAWRISVLCHVHKNKETSWSKKIMEESL